MTEYTIPNQCDYINDITESKKKLLLYLKETYGPRIPEFRFVRVHCLQADLCTDIFITKEGTWNDITSELTHLINKNNPSWANLSGNKLIGVKIGENIVNKFNTNKSPFDTISDMSNIHITHSIRENKGTTTLAYGFKLKNNS